MGSRRVVGPVLALALAPSFALAVDGPVLAKPHQDLADVVPMRVLDEIDLSEAALKVAAKPSLNWRPALNAPQPTADAPAKSTPPAAETSASQQGANASAPAPLLKPLTSAPMLVAPNVTGAAQPSAPPASAAATAAEPDPIKAADAPQLPLRAHRAEAKAPTASEAATPNDAPASSKAPASSETPRPQPAKPRPLAAAPVTPPAELKPAPAAAPVAKPTAAPATIAAKPAPQKPSLAAAPAVAAPAAAQPQPPLSRNMRNLRSRLRSVLSFYYRKPLNTVEHDPWEMMHAMLAYELHSRVRDGGPNGPYMTAVGHLCFNRPSKRQQLMIINKDGKLEAEVGVGVQGHRGQFLAMLAQCNVSPDYPIRVGGKELTIRDLIESEQRSCYAKTELTFKLIGLGHYLASDATWVNDQGETWDIPRLIKEEREQPIRGAACGGTHRLSGLSLAFRRREARGEPLDGEYAEAARFVNQYQAYAFQLQNEDGSLSTEWFGGRGAEEDIDRRLRTTGHLLEWLVYSLPDDQLQSNRTVRTVSYLTELLASNADHEWHLGSIGHAVHALVLYDKRVFRPHDEDAGQVIAAIDPTGSLYREYPIYRGVMRNSPPHPAGFLGLFGTSKSSSSRR